MLQNRLRVTDAASETESDRGRKLRLSERQTGSIFSHLEIARSNRNLRPFQFLRGKGVKRTRSKGHQGAPELALIISSHTQITGGTIEKV